VKLKIKKIEGRKKRKRKREVYFGFRIKNEIIGKWNWSTLLKKRET
jgi:hypothetical protein